MWTSTLKRCQRVASLAFWTGRSIRALPNVSAQTSTPSFWFAFKRLLLRLIGHWCASVQYLKVYFRSSTEDCPEAKNMMFDRSHHGGNLKGHMLRLGGCSRVHFLVMWQLVSSVWHNCFQWGSFKFDTATQYSHINTHREHTHAHCSMKCESLLIASLAAISA